MEVAWWHRLTTSGRVAIAFVLYLAFSVWFFTVGPFAAVEAAGGIVDDDFGSDADDVLDAIAALGAEGQDAYQTFLLGDMVYPLLQGLWMAGFLVLGTQAWRQLPKWSPLLPIAAMVFDWIENLAFLRLLQSPSSGVAWVAVIAMHLKLVAVVLAGIAVAALLVYWITHPVQRRRRHPPARSSARGAPGHDGPGHGRRGRRTTRER